MTRRAVLSEGLPTNPEGLPTNRLDIVAEDLVQLFLVGPSSVSLR
jgi:hypothetical protein